MGGVNANTWTNLSITFTAQGGEEFLYLGRITTTQLVEGNQGIANGCPNANFNTPSAYNPKVYYYIDNVTINREFISNELHLEPHICQFQSLDLFTQLGTIPGSGEFYIGESVNPLPGGILNPNPLSPLPVGTYTIRYVICGQEFTGSINILDAIHHICVCDNNVTLNTPQPDDEVHSYQQWIVADDGYEVSGDLTVIMRAGDYIELRPGTEYASTEYFIAYIDDCSDDYGGPGGRKMEPSSDDTFVVMPNPATTKIDVSIGDAHPRRWTIYSLDGRLIMQNAVSEAAFSIDLQSCAAGLYVLKVDYHDREPSTAKFLKN